MDKALIGISRKGEFKELITARNVASREHARKYWPLVTPEEPYQLLTFVSPSFDKTGKIKRHSHFRRLPQSYQYDFHRNFDAEESERVTFINARKEHGLAIDFIRAELLSRLETGRASPWYFKDDKVSDFHFEGNLLLLAHDVVKEYEVKTSFGCKYRLDIAVLAAPINNKPQIILAGIEVEFGHQFDGRKALISKSQGFPLVSVDISEMHIDEITPQWAETVLNSTNNKNKETFRSTYFYLHDLFYPLYAKLPDFVDKDHRHQYIVFAEDLKLKKLHDLLRELALTIEFESKSFNISIINAISDQSKIMLKNLGDIVGGDWSEKNDHKCLLIAIDRPINLMNTKNYLFHIILVQLILLKTDALVGYKYESGLINTDENEDLWIKNIWKPDERSFEKHKVLPKRLATPTSKIIELIQKLDGSAI